MTESLGTRPDEETGITSDRVLTGDLHRLRPVGTGELSARNLHNTYPVTTETSPRGDRVIEGVSRREPPHRSDNGTAGLDAPGHVQVVWQACTCACAGSGMPFVVRARVETDVIVNKGCHTHSVAVQFLRCRVGIATPASEPCLHHGEARPVSTW